MAVNAPIQGALLMFPYWEHYSKTPRVSMAPNRKPTGPSWMNRAQIQVHAIPEPWHSELRSPYACASCSRQTNHRLAPFFQRVSVDETPRGIPAFSCCSKSLAKTRRRLWGWDRGLETCPNQ